MARACRTARAPELGKLYRDDLNKISFLLSSYQDYVDTQNAFPDLKVGTWGGKGEEALFGDLGVRDIEGLYSGRAVQRPSYHGTVLCFSGQPGFNGGEII